MTDDTIKNAYPDEKEKTDLIQKDEFQIWSKIFDVLSDYGYGLEAVSVDGVPSMKLTKETAE